MPCYHPLTGYRGNGGKIVFNPSKGFRDLSPITVGCGQCIGCRLERSRQWAVRCMHEASLHSKNCFLTLTYDNEHLPLTSYVDTETGEILLRNQVPTLNLEDIQKFMKRLRKKYGSGIRFFQCGEYGETFGRPHHHIILFNHDFHDRKLFKVNHGFPLYTSAELKELWPFGLSSVADVTFESAAYVARYILKKVTGDNSHFHYVMRKPEYVTMSRRPGIAHEWFKRFYNDVYTSDSCVVRSGGKTIIARPPKYYDKLFDLQDSDNFSRIKSKRVKMAKLSVHNTADRLYAREQCHLASSAKLIRPIEKRECVL